MRETCEFWEDHLKALPDGQLVVPNGWSPEHGPDEDGVSLQPGNRLGFVQQLCAGGGRARRGQGLSRQNRRDARQAGDAANRQVGPASGMDDRPRRSERSSPPHVASVRRLSRHANQRRPRPRSWRRPRRFRSTRAASRRTATCANGRSPGARRFTPGCATPNTRTRCCSSFFPRGTPARICSACIRRCRLTATSASPPASRKCWCNRRPAKSNCCPRCRTEWPTGKISGLRARGGYEVSMAWRDGKLVSATVKNVSGDGQCKVRYGGKVVELSVETGRDQNRFERRTSSDFFVSKSVIPRNLRAAFS